MINFVGRVSNRTPSKYKRKAFCLSHIARKNFDHEAYNLVISGIWTEAYAIMHSVETRCFNLWRHQCLNNHFRNICASYNNTFFFTGIYFYTVGVRKSMLVHSFKLHHYVIVQALDMEFTRSFIYSVVSLTTDPWHLPKRVIHRVLSSASSYNCQYPVFSSRSFSSCLRLISRLLITSILPSVFPSVTCLEGSSYARCDQSTQHFFRIFYVSHCCPSWLYVILLRCSLVRSKWSPSFPSTTFQNFPVISDLLSEAPKFQHRTKLYPAIALYQFLP
jgi:hypothetical protein